MSNDELWIDYIENEMSLTERLEARQRFRKSKEDMELISEINGLKEEVRQADEWGALEVTDDDMDRLHSQIMQGIEMAQMAPPPTRWQKWRRSHRHWAVASSTLALLLIFTTTLLVSLSFYKHSHTKSFQFAAQVLGAQNGQSDALVATSHLTEDDLLLDLVDQKFNQLTLQQVEGLVGTL